MYIYVYIYIVTGIHTDTSDILGASVYVLVCDTMYTILSVV